MFVTFPPFDMMVDLAASPVALGAALVPPLSSTVVAHPFAAISINMASITDCVNAQPLPSK